MRLTSIPGQCGRGHAGHHLQVRRHAAVNGPEFVAQQVILRWFSTANIEKVYIDLGKPGQNAAAESC